MAKLIDEHRATVRQSIGKQLSRERQAWPLTKPETLAVVNSIDDWVNANAAVFNQALPAGARVALTAKQKAWLLTAVVEARWRLQ